MHHCVLVGAVSWLEFPLSHLLAGASQLTDGSHPTSRLKPKRAKQPPRRVKRPRWTAPGGLTRGASRGYR